MHSLCSQGVLRMLQSSPRRAALSSITQLCRDCAALASNGELGLTDLPKYKTQYIDAIAKAIASKATYSGLRIVAIIEPDSLCASVFNLFSTTAARLQACSWLFACCQRICCGLVADELMCFDFVLFLS